MTAPATDVDELVKRARKQPLCADAGSAIVLDRERIMSVLPHRGRFLLLDDVTSIDAGGGTIVAHHRFADGAAALDGHFPGDPMWPGVLQVEAIGQAGALLAGLADGEAAGEPPVLTSILQAHFLGPVRPDREVRIVARLLEDGLFFAIVGQCLQGGEIRSVAALRGLRGGTR